MKFFALLFLALAPMSSFATLSEQQCISETDAKTLLGEFLDDESQSELSDLVDDSELKQSLYFDGNLYRAEAGYSYIYEGTKVLAQLKVEITCDGLLDVYTQPINMN
jgi:hypothetical protein